MSKQQFIWVGAVIGLGFGMLVWTPEPGNHMLAERFGAGLPVALLGAAIAAVAQHFFARKK